MALDGDEEDEDEEEGSSDSSSEAEVQLLLSPPLYILACRQASGSSGVSHHACMHAVQEYQAGAAVILCMHAVRAPGGRE